MIRNDATQRQISAADPLRSTWLSANAGSGKTKVLTDRVARLLLNNVSPENILCLTYTKAAASEMQNRLFKTLGAWAMKENPALKKELTELGFDRDITEAELSDARTLFARAIETPGGLKIQTIHSFCSSLLRRFPREAGVSPQFKEIEDRAIELLCTDILEDIALSDQAELLDGITAVISDVNIASLLKDLIRKRKLIQLNPTQADVFGWFNVDPDFSETDLLDLAFEPDDLDLLHSFITPCRESSKPTDHKVADLFAQITSLDVSALSKLENLFLFGAKTKAPFQAKIDAVPTAETRKRMANYMPQLNDLMERIQAVRAHRINFESAAKTWGIWKFATYFLPEYERQKQLRGWLDFDDLIQKTQHLLTSPEVAQWVLFRLDGGIDHILVDEAQDTSPTQWDVIEKLAQEFTSGQGAHADKERTIFVVGDKKQSIYSFQGADPREFDRMKAEFAERLENANRPLQDMTLEYSFRSSHAILSFVDEVFLNRDASGFAAGNRHMAFKSNMPGRVDLWPALDKVEDDKDKNWEDPVNLLGQHNHNVQLADKIATEIQRMLLEQAPIPIEIDKTGHYLMRPVQAGDFLILVRKRSHIFQEIIRACKRLELPIAGSDRLKVGAEIAVKDLAALLAFLDTPEDDLALAVALKSPLFGWTEQSLFALAHNRKEPYLWRALFGQRDAYPTEVDMLQDLRRNADFLRPYDLLERILTRYDGRRNLLARLGSEAEDGINALLSQALAYEQTEVPSLTGFLVWMETDDLEIKRQLDSASDQIRVMTVHGAKGLEAPIVILPDTAEARKNDRDLVISDVDKLVWRANAENAPDLTTDLKQQKSTESDYENDRLLYVALTRAEKWLIIAGAGNTTSKTTLTWYQQLEIAMGRVGAIDCPTPLGVGMRYEFGDWSLPITLPERSQPTKTDHLDAWAAQPAVPPVVPKTTFAPSDLGGAKALASDQGLDEDSAKLRGSQIHRLLEMLPHLPETDWAAQAPMILDHAGLTAQPDHLADLLQHAKRVLLAPELGFLFAKNTHAEVGISAPIAELGGRTLNGIIDRLIITDDSVLAVDFKTNASVPQDPHSTPLGLLRQMGAYAAALALIYPDKPVKTAILWTATGTLMYLPQESVAQALTDTCLDLSSPAA